MADVKWIKITTDIFDDEKILLIESMPSADSIIVIWFKLLAFAGKQNNDGVFMMSNQVAYTDEMLATIFRREINTVRLALKTFEQFGMVEVIENVITIPNWNKHQTLDAYEKKKKRDRLYQSERRAKQKRLIDKSSDKSSDIVISDKDKDKEEEEDIYTTTNSAEKNIFDYYQSRIGVLDGYQVEKLQGYLSDDHLEPELVKRAIDRAADNGKRNFGYANAILKNWAQSGIHTIAQQDEEQRNYVDSKASNYQSVKGQAKSNIPDWHNEHFKEPEMSPDELAELECIQQEITDKLAKGGK